MTIGGSIRDNMTRRTAMACRTGVVSATCEAVNPEVAVGDSGGSFFIGFPLI